MKDFEVPPRSCLKDGGLKCEVFHIFVVLSCASGLGHREIASTKRLPGIMEFRTSQAQVRNLLGLDYFAFELSLK